MIGVFPGFIPCEKHAKEILEGKLELKELIKNRNSKLLEFPNAFKQYYKKY